MPKDKKGHISLNANVYYSSFFGHYVCIIFWYVQREDERALKINSTLSESFVLTSKTTLGDVTHHTLFDWILYFQPWTGIDGIINHFDCALLSNDSY